jgi:hypothetical protein
MCVTGRYTDALAIVMSVSQNRRIDPKPLVECIDHLVKTDDSIPDGLIDRIFSLGTLDDLWKDLPVDAVLAHVIRRGDLLRIEALLRNGAIYALGKFASRSVSKVLLEVREDMQIWKLFDKYAFLRRISDAVHYSEMCAFLEAVPSYTPLVRKAIFTSLPIVARRSSTWRHTPGWILDVVRSGRYYVYRKDLEREAYGRSSTTPNHGRNARETIAEMTAIYNLFKRKTELLEEAVELTDALHQRDKMLDLIRNHSYSEEDPVSLNRFDDMPWEDLRHAYIVWNDGWAILQEAIELSLPPNRMGFVFEQGTLMSMIRNMNPSQWQNPITRRSLPLSLKFRMLSIVRNIDHTFVELWEDDDRSDSTSSEEETLPEEPDYGIVEDSDESSDVVI